MSFLQGMMAGQKGAKREPYESGLLGSGRRGTQTDEDMERRKKKDPDEKARMIGGWLQSLFGKGGGGSGPGMGGGGMAGGAGGAG